MCQFTCMNDWLGASVQDSTTTVDLFPHHLISMWSYPIPRLVIKLSPFTETVISKALHKMLQGQATVILTDIKNLMTTCNFHVLIWPRRNVCIKLSSTQDFKRHLKKKKGFNTTSPVWFKSTMNWHPLPSKWPLRSWTQSWKVTKKIFV